MSERFDELYELYADGALSPEQRREFLNLMSDPANRTRFVTLAMYETVVNDELRITREELHSDVRRGELAISGESQRARASQSMRGKSIAMRYRVKLAIGVLALLLLGGAAYFLIPRSAEQNGAQPVERPSLATLSAGSAAVQRGSLKVPLSAGMPLYDGDILESDSGAILHFAGESSSIEITQRAAVKLELRNGAKTVVLQSGKLALDIAEQPKGLPFILEARDIVAEVPSGAFSARVSDKSARIDATSTGARVKYKDQSAVLPSEHFARVGHDGTLVIGPIAGEKFRFVTYNLSQGRDDQDLQANVEVIRATRADIAALQKIRRDGPFENDDRLQRLADDLGGWHFAFLILPPQTGLEDGKVVIDEKLQAGQSCVGVAVISRWPIESAKARMLTYNPPPEEQWKDKHGVLEATVRLPSGRKVNVFSTHFSINEQENSVHVSETVEFAQKFAPPRILAGNLHCGPEREDYKKFTRVFADAWTEAGKGDGLTNPVPVARWRTDMIFYDKPSLKISTAAVGERGLSDHYSVVAEYYLPWDEED